MQILVILIFRSTVKLPLRLACLATALFTTQSALAFELAHSEGTIKLQSTPSQIVSYDLAVLDSLSTLGIDVAGVAKANYSGHMAHLADKPVTGTLFEPDYPVLDKLKPDLIFAGRRSVPAMPELSKHAPTAVFHTDPLAFLDSFRQANEALGSAFQKQAQVKVALDAIDENVKHLHEANQGKTGAFLFVMRGNIIPNVPGDRYGYGLELAGLQSVLPATDPNAPTPPRPEPGSPEAEAAAAARAEQIATIAKAEPDWLIVMDRGAINDGEKTAEEALAKHPQLSQTKAYKAGRVYYADPNGWYLVGGGLTNLKTITDSMLSAMK